MSNYLKKFMFTLLILTVSYMNSASKAMFIPMPEDEEAASMVFKMRLQEEQKDDQSSIELSGLSTIMTLAKEDMKSYASGVLHRTSTVLDYATRDSNRALVVGGLVASYAVAAAASCYCTCLAYQGKETCAYQGYLQDYLLCSTRCRQAGWKYAHCNPS